jgi:hypothetical protein
MKTVKSNASSTQPAHAAPNAHHCARVGSLHHDISDIATSSEPALQQRPDHRGSHAFPWTSVARASRATHATKRKGRVTDDAAL